MKRTVLVTAVALLVSALVVEGSAGGLASSSRALVKTAYNKKLGKKILVGSTGRTLYMFTTDLNGKDTVCTPQGPYGAECPHIWPALTSAGRPRAGKGVGASLLGVAQRRQASGDVQPSPALLLPRRLEHPAGRQETR